MEVFCILLQFSDLIFTTMLHNTPSFRPDRFNPNDVAPFLQFSTLLQEDPYATLKEDFIQYLWRVKKIYLHDLKTTQGETIEIIEVGRHNTDAGPDFLDAKIKIGGILLAGNVEMHLRSSEWIKHKHQQDPAYQNVILHVVLVEDEIIFHGNKSRIPCLELRSRIPPRLSKTYLKIINNEFWIPCQHLFHKVSQIQLSLWLDRLLVERMQRKTAYIAERLTATQNDWETCFFQVLCRNFGTKVNAEPFEWLARILPLSLLAKHQDRLLHIEALLFGQAGMLEVEFTDAYPKKLKKEYQFFRKKYGLEPIHAATWKMLRLRPANFPTIRIAQLAMLIFKSRHLFSKSLATTNVKEIENMFNLNVSAYWQTHYLFDKETVKRKKTMGRSTIHLLIINTIAPFLFIYGKKKGEQSYKDRALKLLEEIPAEQNKIITRWKELGLKPDSAYQTQALLELKNNFCDRKACLSCTVGHQVLRH